MLKNEYVICIPSYKRNIICNDKTLNTLKNHNINKNNVYVYVANEEEYNLYKNSLNSNLYNKIIIGRKGLVQQREFIMNQWSEKKYIVFLDDDIESVDLSLSKLFKKHSLDYFIKKAFEKCEELKSYIWGVYPVYNEFYRNDKKEYTTELNYIVGAFYGIINRPKLNPIKLKITRENGQKEDVERTLKYFINDGIVLRYNRIGFKTKYYGTTGGLGRLEDRIKTMMEASKKLMKEYGEYGYIKVRSNGIAEFVLRKISCKNEMNNKTKNNKTKNNKTKNNKTKNNKTKNNKTKNNKTKNNKKN